MRRDRIAVLDILEEIEDIEEFMRKMHCFHLEEFLENKLLQKAVMMSIINISEATKYLSGRFINRYEKIHFEQFREIRNVAAHKFGTINFVLVWNILKSSIPRFKNQLQSIHFGPEDY